MPCLNRNPNPRIRWRLWLIWVEFDSQFIVEVDSGENGRIPAHGWHLEAPNRGSPALICGEEWRKPGWWWLAVHGGHCGPSRRRCMAGEGGRRAGLVRGRGEGGERMRGSGVFGDLDPAEARGLQAPPPSILFPFFFLFFWVSWLFVYSTKNC